MKLFALLALSLFATLAHADVTLCDGKLVCQGSGGIPPVIPTCPSPPGAGPCGPVIPACPSPPGIGPCTPVDPGVISCPGFGNTIVLTENWASPGRLVATGMGPKDAVVVVMKTGNSASPSNNLPRISAFEYGTTPSTRIAVLSPKPCDWSAQPMSAATTSGTTVTVPFTVANPGSSFGFYPTLDLNTTYYYNIKNDTNPSCTASGDCGIAVDLSKPGFAGLVAGRAVPNAKTSAADKAYAQSKAALQQLATPADVAAKRKAKAAR